MQDLGGETEAIFTTGGGGREGVRALAANSRSPPLNQLSQAADCVSCRKVDPGAGFYCSNVGSTA